MTTSERITKIFFWGAFWAFLAMSIPHVAYIFRYYEPKNDGFDLGWWVVSYGVAVGIDLLICWLSYSRSESGGTKTDGFVTWAFIFLLAILSWYCNWLFAEVMSGVNVWTKSLPFGWTVGSLTPVIVSAIPMFLIAYTYMSKRILANKQDSLAVLQTKVTRLEQEKALRQRLREAQKGEGFIQQLKEKAIEVKQATSEVFADNQALLPDAVDEPEDLHEGRTTDPLKSERDVEEVIEDVYTPLPVDSEVDGERISEQGYNTEEMPVVNTKRSQRKTPSSTAVKEKRIKKLLSRYPDATLSVIAQKADVSRSYVSQIRKELTSAQ